MALATAKIVYVLPDKSTVECESNLWINHYPGETVEVQTGVDEEENPIYQIFRIATRNHRVDTQDSVISLVTIWYQLEII